MPTLTSDVTSRGVPTDAELAEVMNDKAVTNISGWTEPNSDVPCDEVAYRKRLTENAETLHKKIDEALRFE